MSRPGGAGAWAAGVQSSAALPTALGLSWTRRWFALRLGLLRAGCGPRQGHPSPSQLSSMLRLGRSIPRPGCQCIATISALYVQTTRSALPVCPEAALGLRVSPDAFGPSFKLRRSEARRGLGPGDGRREMRKADGKWSSKRGSERGRERGGEGVRRRGREAEREPGEAEREEGSPWGELRFNYPPGRGGRGGATRPGSAAC